MGNNSGAYPSLGMSMRFRVRVEGLGSGGTSSPNLDLGSWQSCSKLEMGLSYKEVSQGGGHLVDGWLPDKLTYPPVTLERSMEKNSSSKVQEWLKELIKKWDGYPNGAPPSTSVIITLLDYQLNEVMEWTLSEARPIKWTGPSLSATDNKVAIESLTIAHSGFIDLPESSGHEKASLSPESAADGEAVVFDFNPNTVTISHNSNTVSSGKDQTIIVSDPNDLGMLSLSLSKLTFDGRDTIKKCEQLIDWSIEKRPPGADESVKALLPNLTFKWDNFTVRKMTSIKVTLTKVDITYERFDTSGNPTRASVTLGLKPVDPETEEKEQQNPTSGGLPGRGGHLMAAGDTLPGVALDTYGNPAVWRPLAAANGIDDPLRTRPGSALYLPDRTELPGLR